MPKKKRSNSLRALPPELSGIVFAYLGINDFLVLLDNEPALNTRKNWEGCFCASFHIPLPPEEKLEDEGYTPLGAYVAELIKRGEEPSGAALARLTEDDYLMIMKAAARQQHTAFAAEMAKHYPSDEYFFETVLLESITQGDVPLLKWLNATYTVLRVSRYHDTIITAIENRKTAVVNTLLKMGALNLDSPLYDLPVNAATLSWLRSRIRKSVHDAEHILTHYIHDLPVMKALSKALNTLPEEIIALSLREAITLASTDDAKTFAYFVDTFPRLLDPDDIVSGNVQIMEEVLSESKDSQYTI